MKKKHTGGWEAWRRKDYFERKLSGKCTTHKCPNSSSETSFYCETHREHRRISQHEYRLNQAAVR